MRQGDGTDLLGPNDPRSASIGVIYVAPNDDRQSVLAAILTQDKLGRKQIAVVLPDENRAFQRSVDFDGLKSMRRGLKSDIIFIAPSGSSPAEFARQRRFTVYTSLENYASALRAEAAPSDNGKKFGLFGRKAKPTPVVVPIATPPEPVQVKRTLPLPTDAKNEPVAPPPQTGGTEKESSSALPVAGLAAGAALGAAALGADDDDALFPTLEPTATPKATNGALADSTPDLDEEQTFSTRPSQGTAGPNIIAFPTSRPRSTGKLPAAPSTDQDVNIAPSPIPNRRGNTGKMAAAAALGGAAPGGAALGAAAASSATPAGSTAAPGTGAPPPPTRTGSGGGGGGGGGGRRPRRRLLAGLLLLLLTLLLLAGIAFAAPGGLGALTHIVPGGTPTATVTITPKSQHVTDNFVITGVTGTPDASKRQVQARVLSYTSPSQSQSAQSSGSIPGKQATGLLTFVNTGVNAVTISSTTLRGSSGVPVTFNGPITVPSGTSPTITVTGYAVNVGPGGNIPAYDIVGPCCAANITVKNTSAFTGGQNPQPHSVVEQGDIDSATHSLIAAITPQAKTALQRQIHSNEQALPSTLKCTANVSANHQAGDHAPSVTVTGTATCTEEVYDQPAAQAMATNLLKAEAAKNPGPGYALVGNVVTSVQSATVVDKNNTVAIVVHADGVWAYQFTDTLKKQIANAIANKSKQEALTYLQALAGVQSATIDISSGDTLPDASHITINIAPVAGATPTSSPGVTPPVTTPTSAPPITPTPGLGGS